MPTWQCDSATDLSGYLLFAAKAAVGDYDLKLEKAPVEMIVVEHVSQPSEN